MNFTIGGVDSPTTFDAGIGAYVSMALASVGGMAWMLSLIHIFPISV